MAAQFDPIYFSGKPWADRVRDWMRAANRSFSEGNARIVRDAISDIESGLRVVVNIGAFALLKLLEPDGRYLNLYERPVIGGDAKQVSPERLKVDQEMGIAPLHTYFAAVALGGAGVRYYGEYCLVLNLDRIDPDPQLFDRDSYDILLKPIAGERSTFISGLRGRWRRDGPSMVLMRVLPGVLHDRQLVTTGTVSNLVLDDQEFVEVHLQPPQSDSDQPRSFGPKDVEELRETPDEVAVATRMREREADGLRLSAVEREWLLRRENVTRQLIPARIPMRVVTQHGRGYQWK
jgi:hypothetical protein